MLNINSCAECIHCKLDGNVLYCNKGVFSKEILNLERFQQYKTKTWLQIAVERTIGKEIPERCPLTRQYSSSANKARLIDDIRAIVREYISDEYAIDRLLFDIEHAINVYDANKM